MNHYPFASDLTERARRTFAERLIRLADLIKNLSPKQYEHESWITKLGGGCQTTACALGHAAVSPSLFPGLDLKPERSTTKNDTFGEHFTLALARKSDGARARTEEEADKYFGRGSYDAIFCGGAFCDSTCRTPSKAMVVNRILKFARETFGYKPAAA